MLLGKELNSSSASVGAGNVSGVTGIIDESVGGGIHGVDEVVVRGRD